MSHPPVIIIAEPDPIFGNMLRVEFSRTGFAVLMAGTGPEAESFARETSAHMVLLDLALPDQQCIYACARIRHRTDYWNTPIAVTAGALTAREQEAAGKAKATLVLMKPYALSDLLHALMKHVSFDDPLVAPRRSLPGNGGANRRSVGTAATVDLQGQSRL